MTNETLNALDPFVRIFLLAGIIGITAYAITAWRYEREERNWRKITEAYEPPAIFVSTCTACSFTFSGTDRAKVWSEYATHYGKSHQ